MRSIVPEKELIKQQRQAATHLVLDELAEAVHEEPLELHQDAQGNEVRLLQLRLLDEGQHPQRVERVVPEVGREPLEAHLKLAEAYLQHPARPRGRRTQESGGSGGGSGDEK